RSVEVPSVADLLRDCERSAAHLEMRDGYMRSDPMFIAWQQGHRDDPADRASWWRPWLDLVAGLRSRDVQVRRARIVSEPVSEYIRFEYDVTFTNVAGGEEVRWLPRRRASGIALPGNDYWILDGRLVLFNHFTGDGEVAPEGREVSSDPEMVKLCVSAFEAVWERAVPHERYRPA
ncbi:MAG: DUF6879 family protein, partial [Streptosporangiaceae bacterium]